METLDDCKVVIDFNLKLLEVGYLFVPKKYQLKEYKMNPKVEHIDGCYFIPWDNIFIKSCGILNYFDIINNSRLNYSLNFDKIIYSGGDTVVVDDLYVSHLMIPGRFYGDNISKIKLTLIKREFLDFRLKEANINILSQNWDSAYCKCEVENEESFMFLEDMCLKKGVDFRKTISILFQQHPICKKYNYLSIDWGTSIKDNFEPVDYSTDHLIKEKIDDYFKFLILMLERFEGKSGSSSMIFWDDY